MSTKVFVVRILTCPRFCPIVCNSKSIHLSLIHMILLKLSQKKTYTNRYWSAAKPSLTHNMLLRDIKVGVWCAVSAKRIIRSFFFHNILKI